MSLHNLAFIQCCMFFYDTYAQAIILKTFVFESVVIGRFILWLVF